MAFCGISPAFQRTELLAEPRLGWEVAGFAFLSFPVVVLVGLGVMLLKRNAKLDWQIPAWNRNPFDFSHPEQFFHLGAFGALALSVGEAATLLAESRTILPNQVAIALMGLGVLVGLRILTAVYRRQQSNIL